MKNKKIDLTGLSKEEVAEVKDDQIDSSNLIGQQEITRRRKLREDPLTGVYS